MPSLCSLCREHSLCLSANDEHVTRCLNFVRKKAHAAWEAASQHQAFRSPWITQGGYALQDNVESAFLGLFLLTHADALPDLTCCLVDLRGN